MVFLFSYYLFDFIFNLLFMIAYYFTMVIFIFLPFIFTSYFKFIFVPFFLIYFLLRHFFSFVLQMRPSFASSASHYFQFYPCWPFKNPPRRTPRPSELPGKLKSPLPLLLYCNYRSWAWQFYTLFLSTLPYLSFNRPPYPELGHPCRQNIVTVSNKPKHLAEHNSILHGGRKHVPLTCALLSRYTMRIYHTS